MSPKKQRTLAQARMYDRWAQSAQSPVYRAMCTELSDLFYGAAHARRQTATHLQVSSEAPPLLQTSKLKAH